MSEITEEQRKANAERLYAAMECESEEDPMTRFKRAWEGPSNSGVAAVSADGQGVENRT